MRNWSYWQLCECYMFNFCYPQVLNHKTCQTARVLHLWLHCPQVLSYKTCHLSCKCYMFDFVTGVVTSCQCYFVAHTGAEPWDVPHPGCAALCVFPLCDEWVDVDGGGARPAALHVPSLHAEGTEGLPVWHSPQVRGFAGFALQQNFI